MNNIKLADDDDVYLSVEFLVNEILQHESVNKDVKKRILFLIIINKYYDNEITIYSYYIQNKVVGVICLKDNYINYLYVDKKHQNQNIGKQLLDQAISISEEQEYLELDTCKKMIKVYKKWGFVKNKSKTNLKYNIKEN